MPRITGTPLNPPRMSDDGQGSRTSIAHHHPQSKGERAADYAQIPPNAVSKRDATTFEPALEKLLAHGSAAHGGPQLNRANNSAARLPAQ